MSFVAKRNLAARVILPQITNFAFVLLSQTRRARLTSNISLSATNGHDLNEKNDNSGKMTKVLIPVFGTIAYTQILSYFAAPSYSPLILHALAGLSILIQVVAWLKASGVVYGNAPTEKYYDITGSVTYLSLIAVSIIYKFWDNKKSLVSVTMDVMGNFFDAFSLRQVLIIFAVSTWAVRLGSFLFCRICRDGKDTRFTEIKKKPARFLTAWLLQGVWVFNTLIPALIIIGNIGGQGVLKNLQPVLFNQLNYLDIAGFSLWVLGFFFEVVADEQKRLFRANPNNKGKFIKSGLWSISRHPNYFGEIIIWIGIFLASSSDYESLSQFVVAACSPLLVALLLIKVSGIPLLEAEANKRWNTDEAYKRYKENVPVLLPVFGKKGDW